MQPSSQRESLEAAGIKHFATIALFLCVFVVTPRNHQTAHQTDQTGPLAKLAITPIMFGCHPLFHLANAMTTTFVVLDTNILFRIVTQGKNGCEEEHCVFTEHSNYFGSDECLFGTRRSDSRGSAVSQRSELSASLTPRTVCLPPSVQNPPSSKTMSYIASGASRQ